MPIRHGTHHGISFLLGILFSTLFAEIIKKYIPKIFRFFESAADRIIEWFNLPFNRETTVIIIIAFLFVFLYGMIFGIFEKRRRF